MKKNILIISILASLSFACNSSQKETKKMAQKMVGVVVPMEHQALNDIVSGLKEELDLNPNQPVTLKVMNAQGDPNLQRAIIQQLMRDNCDVLVPIGTAASQMTASLAKNHKILCLATDFSVKSTQLQTGPQTTCLNDELSPHDSLGFLHDVFPHIKKITLIYSASEKVAKEIPHVVEAAAARKIDVQKLMVQTLPELYTIGQAVASDSQAIFILKDHLVVSGIQAIVQQAEKRGIPIMTSDEGSVIGGGAFAIAVREAHIGKQGAQIVKMILNGTSPQSIAPQVMKGPFPLFVNRASCKKQGIDLQSFIEKAEALGVLIEYIDTH